ncbi:hypothetical protein ACIP6X_16210 [Streptomyces coeruleorubidus]|jgi:uncharacterized protein with PIN domain|uniref:hypothetical protein n=1 Tax=Streptomyces coeruleorubidus TaxID=116188 RepID=UPI0037FD2B11
MGAPQAIAHAVHFGGEMSDTIILPRCPESGKASFRTEDEARAWLVRQPLIEKIPDRIYRCPGCRYWHFTGSHFLTSQKIKRQRNYGRREAAPRRSRRKRGRT